MIRIAVVSIINNIGGTEISLSNLLSNIPKGKYDITVICLNSSESYVEIDIPEWIRIKFLKWRSPWEQLKYLLKSRKIISAVRLLTSSVSAKLLHRSINVKTSYANYHKRLSFCDKLDEEYDLCISWHFPDSVVNAFSIEKVTAARKTLWIHTDVIYDIPPIDALDCFKRYDNIFCVSEACKNSFSLKYPTLKSKTNVFYNVMDVDAIIEKSYDMAQLYDTFKIVTCGRLSSEKQPLMAIQIVKKLIRSGLHDFKWYFIGTGFLEKEMKASIIKEHLDDFIVLLGFQENPYKYIAKSNLYVQMSVHESFCLTLAEAQILGVPAVTTDFPSAYEIVDDGNTGVIVSNNAESIFCAISNLMNNPDILNSMKRKLQTTCIVPVGSEGLFEEYVKSMVVYS